jgi:hypothetical protein
MGTRGNYCPDNDKNSSFCPVNYSVIVATAVASYQLISATKLMVTKDRKKPNYFRARPQSL